MANVWDASIKIDSALAKRLIESQFPELAPERIERLGEGWDNVAFLINKGFVFRFPRRLVAVALIEREARLLPLIAPFLSLPIPAPQFAGKPVAEYPYSFAGCRLVPGTTADRVLWSEAERTASASSLARFLSSLHRLPIHSETRLWAPGDAIARTDLHKRCQVMRERIAKIEPDALPQTQKDAVLALAEQLSETPSWSDLTCWVHGDLYVRHLLADDSHRLCGVIDWGDSHLGDPALDISIAFSFLPPDGQRIFRQTYGEIDDDTWNRARFRALHYGVVLLAYGQDVADAAAANAGAYALHNAALF